MRRALASFLIAVFSVPLVAALAFVDTGSNVPACCRRNGRHHCSMPDPQNSGAPAFSALPSKCPLFPNANNGPAQSTKFALNAAPGLRAPSPFLQAVVAEEQHHLRAVEPGSPSKTRPSPHHLTLCGAVDNLPAFSCLHR